jgi:hypothetical protein
MIVACGRVAYGEDFGCLVADIVGSNPALGMDVCLFYILRYLKQRPCDELITHPSSPAMCMCVGNKCLVETVTVVTRGDLSKNIFFAS